MKRYWWIWLSLWLFVPVDARSSGGSDERFRRQEISLAYGVLPITGWMNSFVGLFTDSSGPGSGDASVYTRRSTSWGAASFCYNYRINPKVAFGGMYACSGMKEDFSSGQEPAGTSRTWFHTLMPMLKFTWYSRPKLLLYTRAGLGIVISAQAETDFFGKRYSRKNAYLAWQCSPVGVEAGRALAGFLEMGIGTTGLFAAGLRYRF